jgi:CheY-like chemotaxis protein
MSLSILVVEDHTELRQSIRDLLAQPGYEVRCASSVDEAIGMLESLPSPCLVLWDPVTLDTGMKLVSYTASRGVHLATIPVGVTATGQAPDGTPILAKRLTSREAIVSVVREHCPESDAVATS